MSMPPYTLHGLGTKVLKVELVAAFAGVELHRPPFTWGLTQKTRRFLELSPTGKVSGQLWELHFGTRGMTRCLPLLQARLNATSYHYSCY